MACPVDVAAHRFVPGSLCLLLNHLPNAEIKLGLQVRVGQNVLGIVVGAAVLENGNILVKLAEVT